MTVAHSPTRIVSPYTRRLACFLVAVAAASGQSGCAHNPLDDPGSNTPFQTVTVNLSLEPAGSMTLAVGASGLIDATANVPAANAVGLNAPSNFMFSSAQPAVASVHGNDDRKVQGSQFSQTATVNCIAAGSASISVTAIASGTNMGGSASGTVAVTCQAPPSVAKVVPNTTFVKAASTPTQLTATVQDASGAPVTNTSLSWTGSNPSVATVSAGGLATPVSPGFLTITATATDNPSIKGQAILYVQGNGTCSLNPSGVVLKTLTVAVQSDPGGHAAQIGFSSGAQGPYGFDFSGGFSSQLNVSGPQGSPFVLVTGGWVQSAGDCGFVLNGMGTIGGQSNVGVRLEGTWKNGSLSLKYTVGTNGELSGGPTVYTVTG